MPETCAYCGQDLAAYEPVSVHETVDGEVVPAGRFCNYGCLAAHIDEAELATGACCQIDPS